jgi:hypothetical protein
LNPSLAERRNPLRPDLTCFDLLKEMTLIGYFTSELANK